MSDSISSCDTGEEEHCDRLFAISVLLSLGLTPSSCLGSQFISAFSPSNSLFTPCGFSCFSRRHFALRFWNQVFTCLSLSCNILANLFRSGGERYFCVSNFFSSSTVWSLENLTWPPFLLCRGL
uniref:Uncharacterized protein n=1 Tax=Anguilla anguilla TaxID=7936 RepID=A0A0E9XI94_ANGAN